MHQIRQQFSLASKKVSNIPSLASVEFLRHEFESFDNKLEAHSLKYALDDALV